MIAQLRYSQTSALALPNVSMAVAADIGDPAGVLHPIHPPFKPELARRVHLAAEAMLFGNTTVPPQGPTVLSAKADYWDASWGSYHYGTGPTSKLSPSASCRRPTPLTLPTQTCAPKTGGSAWAFR